MSTTIIGCKKSMKYAYFNQAFLQFDFYKLFGVHMACSHPQRDAIGDLYNIATSFTTGCKYQIM